MDGKELARLFIEQKKLRASLELENASYKDWLLKQARHEEHVQYVAEAKAKMAVFGIAVDAGAAQVLQGELNLA